MCKKEKFMSRHQHANSTRTSRSYALAPVNIKQRAGRAALSNKTCGGAPSIIDKVRSPRVWAAHSETPPRRYFHFAPVLEP
ncbi:hypothetical protein EVAR_45042_1 [Eumeta japonica]|uniref:Uncharacterized protein n=1 Tax=Eumeta variegata TaxID=151549 RepID=A0A4C1YKM1_EUMVA|nr:hypothetical protein EVAR_45042_1 [Eumeta japonica]